MLHSQQLETVKPGISPEISFKAFADLYENEPSVFSKSARKFLRAIKATTEKLANLKGELPQFGLQIAVLFDRFCSVMMKQPEWAGKDPNDYVRHALGLEKADRIPPQAYANARVFLGTVKPGKGKPVWTEPDYLACTQRALSLLAKITTHKKVKDFSPRWQDHPMVTKALKVASFRAKDYERQLAQIAEELDGEKPAVVVTKENLTNVVKCLVKFLDEEGPVAGFDKTALNLEQSVEAWTAKILEAKEHNDGEPEESEEPTEGQIAKHIEVVTDFSAHVKQIVPDAKGKAVKALAKGIEKFYGANGKLPATKDELDSFMQQPKPAAAAA